MDQWGPYLPERVIGPAPAVGAGVSKSCEELCNHDGIFGFCNSGGTAGASLAAWIGGEGQPKERLLQSPNEDDGCLYLPGLADPQYRYCTCRYRCQQQASGLTFDIRFELVKEQANRIYYRLTVENRSKTAAAATHNKSTLKLTVASQLWVCHADCGRIQLADGSKGGGADGSYVRLRIADACRGQACLHLADKLESGNTDLLDDSSRRVCSYRLHYPPDRLQTAVFCSDSKALDSLIIKDDRSMLCSDQTSGCRVALIYRLQLPRTGGASESLCFMLAAVEAPAPDNPVAISVLMSRAAALATAELTPNTEEDNVNQQTIGVVQRALSGLLWNRQLCHSESPDAATSTSATLLASMATQAAPPSCLTVVPDKWNRPGLAGWEHGLHAIALCRISRELALTELRNQLGRMSAGGEMLTAPARVAAEPPIWPLALLEIMRYHNDLETTNGIFCDLLRHLHWWLLVRRDSSQHCTLDGGVLGLNHAGWMEATQHDGVSNDSLVWSGFFCAKMVHLAALLQRQELKSLLDLFNAAVSSLHGEAAFVGGLFRPNLLASDSARGTSSGSTGAALSPPCCRGAPCCCVFGLVPLLGCACIPRAGLAADDDARTLVDWLQWLASDAVSRADTPCLFVRGEAKHNTLLISWLGEAEFLQTCKVLFDPAHYLGPHGLRCTSRLLCQEGQDDDGKGARCRPVQRESIVSLPWNYLVLEALKCWESAYGQRLQLDYPTGAGVRRCLNDVIVDISRRLMSIFTKIDEETPMLREYYQASSGRGIGGSRASWSGLIANIAENLTRQPTLAVFAAPTIPRSAGQILPRSSVVVEFRENLRSSIKLDEFAPETSFDWDDDGAEI